MSTTSTPDTALPAGGTALIPNAHDMLLVAEARRSVSL